MNNEKRLKTVVILTTYGLCVALFIVMFLLAVKADGELADEREKVKAWEKSYKALDSEATNKYNDYEHTIDTLKTKIDENNTSIINLTKQVEALKQDNNELRLQVEDYKKKEEEAKVKEEEVVVTETETVTPDPGYTETSYVASSGCLTSLGGVNNYNGQLETWYNLPMEGVIAQAQNFGIYGEYWIREDGVKMYGDYVILACNRDVHPMGSIVETSLGTGISLDTGAFAASNPNQVDIAVSW